ncbi:indole-3-glycerol phosphate synthase [Helicobacter sp. MIT 05-5293]|uniref:hypothetical protein n=1 Tax=Helicobacter sp. MIT 05-5293 TaxID=1548149 RepID=UPI00068AAF89|nr:hypothetical protein [Helicobacter sp. MIT 05-5293]TLD79775.1 indole-3-glycerol phosphate synthase [Helicobacter sp. MIT 05-5293]
MREVSSAIIQKTLKHLEERKKIIDFDTLGRTLAYSPFVPRVDRDFFVRETQKESQPKLAYQWIISPYEFCQAPENYLYQGYQNEQDYRFDAYWLDLWSAFLDTDFDDRLMGFNLLESISLLRRHSTLPIIHCNVFLQPYQILESALFGADALMMPASIVSAKELQSLLDFAYRLGFVVFVGVENQNDLKKAIFSGANTLFVGREHIEEILTLIPQSCVIASDSDNQYGVDLCIKNFN